ncbi:MAG: hypothetical protein R2697_04515 [Ilumatobacteraceae bacterium]
MAVPVVRGSRLVELFAGFNERVSGWAQFAVFAAGLGVLVGGFVVVNVVRRRPPFALPDDIGAWEVAAYLLGPAVLVAFVADNGWQDGVAIIAANAVLLLIAYAVTSYGFVPALRVGAVQAAHQVGTVTGLFARGLPIMLLITAFVFLNAEVWQVAHDFEPAYFVIVVATLVGLAGLFLGLQVPGEVRTLNRFNDWAEIEALAAQTDAPIVEARVAGIDPGAPVETPRLTRREVVNAGLLLMISQLVQAVLVGAVSAVFYVGFGLFAVRETTILQWTTTDELDPIVRFDFLGGEMVLTWEHIAVAGFIGAFATLQFAVSSINDATYREQFRGDTEDDVREVFAVRALTRRAIAAR